MQPQSTTPPEEWRPVVGYEGWYDVSSLGNVRREAPGSSNTHVGYILKGVVASNGYPQVGLCRNGHIQERDIHVLVAEAFIGPRPIGCHVNHKDRCRSNNRVSNLEWIPATLNRSSPGEANGRAKLTEADILDIRAAQGKIRPSALAKAYGVSRESVWAIQTHKSWRHL